MTPKQVAARYLTYFSEQDGVMIRTDNAPAELRRFILGLPKDVDAQVVYEALRAVAGQGQPEVPQFRALCGWMLTHHKAIDSIDVILSSKVPPKTLATLLRNAYLAQVAVYKFQAQQFIQNELDQFTQ